MVRLKYLDPADQQYKLLPVGGGSGGGPEEVTIAGTKPGSPYTDLWVDTATPAPVTDWSVADNRYLTSGFRNVLRNGDMQIAQRGNGPWTANGYTVDGWSLQGSGGTRTATRTVATVTGPNWLSCAITGQSAANDYALIQGNIESVLTLNGQQATVSFIAKAASGTPKIGLEIYQNFGSGGSPSTDTATAIGTVILSTVATKYTVTFTVPSVSGATLGTNGNHYAGIVFWISAGTAFASRAPIGIQNNTFSITDVQLEAGSAATAFERLPVQQQLAWCQRYFFRAGANNPHNIWTSQGETIADGLVYTTANATPTIRLPVVMRTAPTIVTSAVGGFRMASTVGVVPSAIGVSLASGNQVTLSVTFPTTTFPGTWAYLTNLGGQTPYIDCSAEL